VVFFGPPYLPTFQKNITVALDLLDLKPGQTLLELGCGDGRVVLAAARRGIKVIGIELSPWLALLAWLRTRRYGKQVKIIWGNYFLITWPQADAIFTFMLPRLMVKLDRRIAAWHTRPVRLASFAFKIPGKKPNRVVQNVFVYNYS